MSPEPSVLWTMFHRLWGKAQEHPATYDKREWALLQEKIKELDTPKRRRK